MQAHNKHHTMRIVFLDASSVGDASLDGIEKLGELVCHPTSTAEEARQRVGNADVIITNKVVIDAQLMDCAPKLKLICEAATGINNIDTEEAARRGIKVKNVAGYSTESVVQLTFAMILDMVCRTGEHSRWIKDGHYSASPIFTNVSSPYMELDGKTMGIIGMGTIGHRVAEVATAFGMHVIYFSTSGTSHCKDYPSVSLDELLAQSDIVSIHAPLNDRTRGLLGPEEFGKMKTSAYLVNIGRGGIVNEQALADAISGCRIAGAALDVFTKEPISQDNPLLHTSHPERLTLTPHIGWASREAIGRLIKAIETNISDEL